METETGDKSPTKERSRTIEQQESSKGKISKSTGQSREESDAEKKDPTWGLSLFYNLVQPQSLKYYFSVNFRNYRSVNHVIMCNI